MAFSFTKRKWFYKKINMQKCNEPFYSGRNFEYFSKDSTISYDMGMAEANGLSEGHLISMFKRFVGNDQETNRHGVATFMTE